MLPDEPEQCLEGVRFRVKHGKKYLFCSFAFCTLYGENQTRCMISPFEGEEFSVISFADIAMPEDDPRGQFFIDDVYNNQYIKSVVKIIRDLEEQLKPEETFFIGPSKGGSAAISVAIQYGKGICIVNAPQYYIVDYMKAHDSAEYDYSRIIKGLTHDCAERSKAVNEYIPNLIAEHAQDQTKAKFLITCGILDKLHWHDHILPMIKNLREAGFEADLKIVCGEHVALAIDNYRHVIEYFKRSGKNGFKGVASFLQNYFLPLLSLPLNEETQLLLPYLSVEKHFLEMSPLPDEILINYIFENIRTAVSNNMIFLSLPALFNSHYKLSVQNSKGKILCELTSTDGSMFHFPRKNVKYIYITCITPYRQLGFRYPILNPSNISEIKIQPLS